MNHGSNHESVSLTLDTFGSDISITCQKIPDEPPRLPEMFETSLFRPGEEESYGKYSREQKQSDLTVFVMGSILMVLYLAVSLVISENWSGYYLAVCAACVAVVAVKAILGFASCHLHQNKNIVLALSYIGWILTNTVVAVLLVYSSSSLPSLALLITVNVLTFTALPIPLLSCVALTTFASTTFIIIQCLLYMFDNNLPVAKNVSSEAVLLLSSIVLGFIGYTVDDSRHRQSFVDTQQSLKMRRTIEKQALEQEELLLSVLPEHVAVKMRQDLGTAHDGQFKKIYMSRHENVSILFADIVGFTVISSTYSACQLVRILNELFARFDQLSQKYSQMRIKILGDCYYCICGAPAQRDDHAILSVYMGLAMIDAIRCVRESTHSPVDMRVGIHTGAVLAGVLGQKQWQYDVYSQDVELANKMESSGIPGRVHVSSKTKSFLGDSFDVEPAYGERREESLRLASLETYFILRARQRESDADPALAVDGAGIITDRAVEITPGSNSGDCCCSSTSRHDQSPQGYSRDSKGQAYVKLRLHWLTQSFVDTVRENKYRKHGDVTTIDNIYALPIAFAGVVMSMWLLDDWTTFDFLIPMAGSAFLCLVCYLILLEAGHQQTAPWLRRLQTSIGSSMTKRCILTLVGVLLVFASELLTLVSSNISWRVAESSLLMAATAMAPHLPSWLKGIALLTVTAVYSAVLWTTPDSINVSDGFWSLFMQCVLLASIAATLYELSRQLDRTSRLLFLCQDQVEEQREQAADLQYRNQTLVRNILPPHVAAYFLDAQRQAAKNDIGKQLYSQSYADVGVLFASIPNFSEFYSEESVNNQGLECLRFLNEVISDFDALLDREEFMGITKIKTIGSTYMAASGLNSAEEISGVGGKWRTLALLVEFALAMQSTLQNINVQSFNHFVLRMGINHGPITAGVIGASKPHYDIWGNAVNVASRMESTGKAGCIQVTEETKDILQDFGYTFEQRGLVSIKGKGQLLTFYLTGRSQSPTCHVRIRICLCADEIAGNTD